VKLRNKTKRDIANICAGNALLTFSIGLGAAVAAHLPVTITAMTLSLIFGVIALAVNP